MATSSIGQIVVLGDAMADRIIESTTTAQDRPFGKRSGFFSGASDEDVKRWVATLERTNRERVNDHANCSDQETC
jgi:hypothetical protein